MKTRANKLFTNAVIWAKAPLPVPQSVCVAPFSHYNLMLMFLNLAAYYKDGTMMPWKL